MKKILISALSLCLLSPCVSAQTNWGLRSGIGVEKKITQGLEAGVDAKYYQTDNFRNTDRWSIGLSLDKRLYRNKAKTFNVKAGLGYKYMNVYHDWSTKYKDDAEGVEADGVVVWKTGVLSLLITRRGSLFRLLLCYGAY